MLLILLADTAPRDRSLLIAVDDGEQPHGPRYPHGGRDGESEEVVQRRPRGGGGEGAGGEVETEEVERGLCFIVSSGPAFAWKSWCLGVLLLI